WRLGCEADALRELGRDDAAVEVVQALVDRKPASEAFTRVALLREIHGDAAGALDAWNRALDATKDGIDRAWIFAQMGELERCREPRARPIRAGSRCSSRTTTASPSAPSPWRARPSRLTRASSTRTRSPGPSTRPASTRRRTSTPGSRCARALASRRCSGTR